MNNIMRIRHSLEEYKLNALLVINPANRFFATGFQSSAGVLLVTERDAWFFTDSRYIEAAEGAIRDAKVVQVSHEAEYFDRIKSALAEDGITEVGFEESHVTYSGYLDLKKELKVRLRPARKLLEGLRSVKSAADLVSIKKAQRVAEKSFNEILPIISTDITEKELAAELLFRFLKNGADDKSFDVIVVSGPNSSMPHGVPGNEKLCEGFLTIDFGVRLCGWCSDTTRTLCVGRPDDEMVRVYDTVLAAQEAGIGAVRAGVSGRAVDAAARSVIDAAGYGEYFRHGFGHGVGLEVHEVPVASRSSKDILPLGSVISAEPGIYLPGRYGVRIEDVLYVTETGCENITDLTKKLIVI